MFFLKTPNRYRGTCYLVNKQASVDTPWVNDRNYDHYTKTHDDYGFMTKGKHGQIDMCMFGRCCHIEHGKHDMTMKSCNNGAFCDSAPGVMYTFIDEDAEDENLEGWCDNKPCSSKPKSMLLTQISEAMASVFSAKEGADTMSARALVLMQERGLISASSQVGFGSWFANYLKRLLAYLNKLFQKLLAAAQAGPAKDTPLADTTGGVIHGLWSSKKILVAPSKVYKTFVLHGKTHNKIRIMMKVWRAGPYDSSSRGFKLFADGRRVWSKTSQGPTTCSGGWAESKSIDISMDDHKDSDNNPHACYAKVQVDIVHYADELNLRLEYWHSNIYAENRKRSTGVTWGFSDVELKMDPKACKGDFDSQFFSLIEAKSGSGSGTSSEVSQAANLQAASEETVSSGIEAFDRGEDEAINTFTSAWRSTMQQARAEILASARGQTPTTLEDGTKAANGLSLDFINATASMPIPPGQEQAIVDIIVGELNGVESAVLRTMRTTLHPDQKDENEEGMKAPENGETSSSSLSFMQTQQLRTKRALLGHRQKKGGAFDIMGGITKAVAKSIAPTVEANLRAHVGRYRGVHGYTGHRGSTGHRGGTGHTGHRGSTGHKGSTGSRGVHGSKGNTGREGHIGHDGKKGSQGPKGKAAPKWPDTNLKEQLKKAGVLKTPKLAHDAKDDFRTTNWQAKLADVSPYEEGWFGRAYVSSMYSSVEMCVANVKHITTPMIKGEVPTGVNTVSADDGGGMDSSEFKPTGQVPYETGFLETHEATATASKTHLTTAVALLESRSHATLFLEELEEGKSNSPASSDNWDTASLTLKVPAAVARVAFTTTGITAGSPAAHHAVRLAIAHVGKTNDALAYDFAKAQAADPLPLALEILQDHVDRLSSSSRGSNRSRHESSWDEPKMASADAEVDFFANDDDDDLIDEKLTAAATSAADDNVDDNADDRTDDRTDDNAGDVALLVRRLQMLELDLEMERTARKAQDEQIVAMQMEMNTKMNTRDLEENLDIILAQHEGRQESQSQSQPPNANKPQPPTAKQPGFKNVARSLSKFASPAMLQVGARAGIKSSVRMRKGGFDFGFSKITGWVEKQFNKFKDKVVTPLKNWFEKAIKTATKFLEGMVNVVKKALEKAKNWLKGLIEQVKRALDKMVDALKSIIDKVKQALQKAKDWLKGLIDKLASMVKELINKLKQALHKAKEWLKGLINELKKKVMSVVDAIKKKLKEAKDWLLGIINKIKDKIMKVVKDIIKTVKGWVDKALSFVYKIKDFFMGLIQKAWDFIKAIGRKLQELWKKIKELPALVYSWIQKGITAVMGLVDKLLRFFGDTKGPKKIAENNCKILKKIIVVWDMCYWTFVAYEMVVGKIMTMFAFVVDFLFAQVKKLLAKDPFNVSVNFGTKKQAEDMCVSYRNFIPFGGLFNIPTFIMCHVVARLIYVANDLIDLVLGFVTKMSKKLPDWGGRTFWATKDGLTFGSKHGAMEDCKGFAKLLGLLKLNPILVLACLLSHRLMSGVKSISDALFHHLAALISVVPFPSIKDTEDACASWKTGIFKAFGGSVTHGMFVQCTVYARFFAIFDWIVHLAWDKLAGLLNKAAGSKLDNYSFEHARKACAWKHYSLLGMPAGFAARSICQLQLRVLNTVVAVLGKLIGMLFDIFEIKVIAFPPAPDPTCGPIMGLINKLPGVVVSILKELPLFPIEILCDTVMRLMKYLISVAQGVFALVDMILAGVGKVAKVIMDITGVVFKEARKVMKDIFPAFVELDAETQAELDEHGIKDDLKDVAESLKPIAEMGMKIIPMAKQAYDLYYNALPSAITSRLQFYKVCDGDNKKCTTPGKNGGKAQKKDQLRLPGTKGAKRCAKTIYQCTAKKPGKGRAVPTPSECGQLRLSQRTESSMTVSGRFNAKDYYIEPKCVIDAAANDVLDDIAGGACDTLEISDEIILLAIINQMNQISDSLGSLGGKKGSKTKKGSMGAKTNKISEFLCTARAKLKALGPRNTVTVTLCNMPNAVPWSIHDWDEDKKDKPVVDREDKDEETQGTQPIRARVNVQQAGETVYEATFDKAFHLHLKKDTGGILSKIANLKSSPSIVREAFNQVRRR